MVGINRSIGKPTVLLGVAALAACGSDDGGGSPSPGGPDPAALSVTRAEPSGTPTFAGSGDPVLPPQTFSQTFTTPGTYLYFCVVHGTPDSGRRGTIVVQ
jgi:hypothetical protein